MNSRCILVLLAVCFSVSLSAQTQSWQWIKAGGSSSDNNSVPSAECKIAGCDARGNVYAVGGVNGPNMRFDTFSSAGSYSGTNTGLSYLLFSYDCAGQMRWAKQIGDEEGNFSVFGLVTDIQGNTYFAGEFWYGYNGGLVRVFLGDSILTPTAPVVTQPYLCLIKYDSLGHLVWFKNLQEDTAHSPHVGQAGAGGLRIGSSGHLWMQASLDSNYAISPNLHTSIKGNYNMEIDPATGNILGGYYTSNKTYGDPYHPDAYYDLDQNENYYETGQLKPTFSSIFNGDTLILANKRVAVDTNYFSAYVSFIFSLDKHGNFRFLIMQDTIIGNPFFELSSCKFDMLHNQLLTGCYLGDSGVRIQGASFGYHKQNLGPYGAYTNGFYCIDGNGHQKWCKYITDANGGIGGMFRDVPLTNYIGGLHVGGTEVFDNIDTIRVGSSACVSNCSYYYRLITKLDENGRIKATYIADLGNINTNIEGDRMPYATTDWRGNVYMGGCISSYMATSVDSVVNTDFTSGNFFIAKLGISDCSCPTPGAQFTQIIKGDTVYFFGTSINHSDSIHWRLGDSTISLTDTFSHIYRHDGTFNVTAIAYGNCGVDSITKQITVTHVGISAIEPNKTNVHPNPVKDAVNIEVSGPAKIGLVIASGASMWDAPVQVNQQGTYVFDMSKYSSAVYYFIVQYTNGKTDVLKVVKE